MKSKRPQIPKTPEGITVGVSIHLNFDELSAVLTANQIQAFMRGVGKITNTSKNGGEK